MGVLLILQTCQVMGKAVGIWIRGSFQGSAFFEMMEKSLSDEYLVRCLTPTRSGTHSERSVLHIQVLQFPLFLDLLMPYVFIPRSR